MHELHELCERLLITAHSFVHERDHISLAAGNHFTIFAALITIQYLFDADSGWSLRSTCREARNTLAKLSVPGGLP